MTTKPTNLLHGVARLYNVQTIYRDGFGRLQESPVEAFLRVLRLLGAPVEKIEDLAGARRERRQLLWRRAIDPVVVAWDGAVSRIKLRLPRRFAEAPASYQVALESGEIIAGNGRDDSEFTAVERRVEGARYVTRRLILPERLPFGYHRLRLQIGKLSLASLLFSSPSQTYASSAARARRWGLFCPLYALQSHRSWGAGDFSDLEALADFTGQAGGAFVGTLPLLAGFLDEPFNPSPYAPVSRLFWNELYLDIARIAALEHCPAATAKIDSADFQEELAQLRRAPLVEYRRLMALKRMVLEDLCRGYLNQPGAKTNDLQDFIANHPAARDYAAFRATTERWRQPWEQWPARQRDGRLDAGDYDPTVQRYHLYVQWQAHEQMRALAEKTKASAPALYLDFPLGVNRDGYDVWRERQVFTLGASGGAPPDGFFTRGQNWGFPPINPDGLRRQGYRYYIECVRHHLKSAGLLRIDHVMGLHRLFWIPEGCGATDGVYVGYPAEEFYAILSLESHRHKAQIVGENLGVVPPYVNAAMARHNIHGMHVGQFGVRPDPHSALDAALPGSVASLNTHDTATFAGFCQGHDIHDRVNLGLLAETDGAAELRYRAAQVEALSAYLHSQSVAVDSNDALGVLKAWLAYLASSTSDIVLVNLEDLWLEPAPQNVPGTWEERPNWRRKARFLLDEIYLMPQIREILRTVDDLRKQARP